MTITRTARRWTLALAAAIALFVALVASAAAPQQAEACALTPLSPCGIVGSKVWPVYDQLSPTVEETVWKVQNCSVNGTLTGECQPG